MGLGPDYSSWAEYSVPRVTGIKTKTKPSTSVPKNQEPKWNRTSRFRFSSALVLGFFGSVLGFWFFVPRAICRYTYVYLHELNYL